MSDSDPDQGDPNRSPHPDQDPLHDMDNRHHILDTLHDHQVHLIELLGERTTLMRDHAAMIDRMVVVEARMNAIEQRVRNPFAGILPLDVQLRNANQNQADGTTSMTLTVSHPQAQVHPNISQPATAGPSTTGQGAVNTAGRQNNTNRPTAAGNSQHSARSNAAQDGLASSSRTSQNREIKEEPASSLFPGSQNRTDAEIARDLQDRENDRTLGTAPLPQTSQDLPENLYGDSSDEQTQTQRQNTRDGKKPSNQKDKKSRKPTPDGKNADGNDQAAQGVPERRRSARFPKSEALPRQENASSTNRDSQQPSEDATMPSPLDDGENITVRHPSSSVGGARPRSAATGRLSTVNELPEVSGAANSGDDGGEPASPAKSKKKRRSAKEASSEDAEGKDILCEVPEDDNTDTCLDVEDNDAEPSPKKLKAKGKGKATKSKQ